jgi:CheY-like chemotaxis protein
MSEPETTLDELTVLIVEDGDEYLDNLGRFVAGPRYLQAHDGAAALELLQQEAVDLVYLDMRFDRIDPELLLGDLDATASRFGGDRGRALKHLQNNQGLFILDALVRAGHAELPVILAYDFTREARRFDHLVARTPHLTWVPDAITPDEIQTRMLRVTGGGG